MTRRLLFSPFSPPSNSFNLFKALNLLFGAFLLSATATSAELKAGLVLDRGGKDDKSFNASAYEGAMRAKARLGVFVKYVEASDDNAFEPSLRSFAQRDFDLIIGIGFARRRRSKKCASNSPKRISRSSTPKSLRPNVRSLMFEEHEGAYLIGAIAAMTSKTGKVGFVGGMDIPLIRRFPWPTMPGPKKLIPKSGHRQLRWDHQRSLEQSAERQGIGFVSI